MAGLTSQNVDKLSKKRLVGLVKNDMGYTDDDFDFKSITKEELIEIVKNTMGSDMNKGGVVKSRTGPQDFRKGGMVLSTMDNRRNK